LFETTHDIKNYQIEIANFFRNPVDPINFGMYYYLDDKNKENSLKKDEKELLNKIIEAKKKDNPTYTSKKTIKSILEDKYNAPEEEPNQDSQTPIINSAELDSNKRLYRVLFMFSDFLWSKEVEVPKEQLFLIFNFLGNNYKVKLGTHYERLHYFDVDFFKIFYIITDEQRGFDDYVKKNKV